MSKTKNKLFIIGLVLNAIGSVGMGTFSLITKFSFGTSAGFTGTGGNQTLFQNGTFPGGGTTGATTHMSSGFLGASSYISILFFVLAIVGIILLVLGYLSTGKATKTKEKKEEKVN